VRLDSRLEVPCACGEAPDQRGQLPWWGIYDKLGVESRPVIVVASWICTAPAQIGGLEMCEREVRTTNRGLLIRKGRISRRFSVDRWGSLESAGSVDDDD
jgi:hypothetical protein